MSDVQRIVELAAHRLVRSLRQRGVLDSTEADALAEESPLLSALSSASVQGQLATGPRAGRRVRCPALGSESRVTQRAVVFFGAGSAVLYRCGSSEVPPQDALVRWNDPPGLISVGTDREVGCAGTSAPAQPGALSRCPGAQCRISSFGRAGLFGVAGHVIGGGLYGFPLSSSLRLGGFIGTGLRRGCDASVRAVVADLVW